MIHILIWWFKFDIHFFFFIWFRYVYQFMVFLMSISGCIWCRMWGQYSFGSPLWGTYLSCPKDLSILHTSKTQNGTACPRNPVCFHSVHMILLQYCLFTHMYTHMCIHLCPYSCLHWVIDYWYGSFSMCSEFR